MSFTGIVAIPFTRENKDWVFTFARGTLRASNDPQVQSEAAAAAEAQQLVEKINGDIYRRFCELLPDQGSPRDPDHALYYRDKRAVENEQSAAMKRLQTLGYAPILKRHDRSEQRHVSDADALEFCSISTASGGSPLFKQAPTITACMGFTVPYLVLVGPPWFVIICLCLWSPIRIERRRFRGFCLHCGYDLRGSQLRCPECGNSK